MFAYIPHELAFLQTVLSHRPECLNSFFAAMHYLDTGGFYLMLATLVFTALNPRLGKQYFLLSSIIIASNYGLKHLLLQPRPFILDPSLALVTVKSEYGLPSGAAQAATALVVFLRHYYKQSWVLVAGLGYVTLICISRVYIGVHFISDVVVGCLLGFVITRLFLLLSAKLPTHRSKVQNVWAMLLGLGLLAFSFSFKMAFAYQAAFVIIGSILVSHLLIKPTPPFEINRIRSTLLGVSLVALVYYLKSNWHLPLLPMLLVYILLLNLSILKVSLFNKLARL